MRGAGRRRAVIAALLAMVASPAGADDWPGPRVMNVFSEDGRRFVQITPGASVGESVGFEGAPKGAHARAEFFARRPDRSYARVADVRLENPVAPVDALVSNSGHLVTLDNWHNAGYGAVVVVYGPSGKKVAAWPLERLYDAEHLERLPTSVSSRWWRCPAHGFSDPAEQTQVYVTERLGGVFVFELATGSFSYAPGSAGCP